MMSNFWDPFVGYIGEGGRTDHAEAQHEHVRLRIGERPKTIVVFLACCIPQSQGDLHIVHDDIRCVIVKAARRRKNRSGEKLEHCITHTVGMYSSGKMLLVKEINMHVLPTVPSPTMTDLIGTL